MLDAEPETGSGSSSKAELAHHHDRLQEEIRRRCCFLLSSFQHLFPDRISMQKHIIEVPLTAIGPHYHNMGFHFKLNRKPPIV